MIRVVALYPQSNGNWFNADYYKKNHLKMVKELMGPFGLVGIEMDLGINAPDNPAPYFAIGYMLFDTMENLQKGMAVASKELMEDIPRFSRDVILQIGEVQQLEI
jgi:uncharacterized protein (TIGR02118 family)